MCGIRGQRGWWERGQGGEGDEGGVGKWCLVVLFADTDARADEARCDAVLDEGVVGGFFGAAPEHGRWELVGEVGTGDI